MALALVFGLAALVGRGYLAAATPAGHDAVYYLPRYVEFYQSLTEGVLVPRWAPDLGNGYGQPLFLFTPPLFYYLVAAGHVAGLGLHAASGAAVLLILTTAGCGMFLLARSVFGPPGGLLAAAAYLTGPYFLATLFARYAMGDFTAFAFLPYAAWGITQVAMATRAVAMVTGSLGVAAVALSSNHVALMTLPALTLTVSVIALQRQSLVALVRGGLGLGLGLGVAAFFWLPALLERTYVHVDRAVRGVYDYGFHFLEPRQILWTPWGYGGSVGGPDDGLALSLGAGHVLLAAVALAAGLLRYRRRPSGALPLVCGALVLTLGCVMSVEAARPLWSGMPVLQYLQFPWRFLSLASAACGFLAGGATLAWPSGGRQLAGALVVAALLAAPQVWVAHPPPAEYDLPEALTPRNIADWRLVGSNAQEFEPIWVRERPSEPATAPLSVLTGQATWNAVTLGATVREIEAHVPETARIRLNTHFFPGWKLWVNEVERPIKPNPAGLIEVDLPQGPSEIRLVFADTPPRLAGAVLSVCSAGVLMLATTVIVSRARARRRAET